MNKKTGIALFVVALIGFAWLATKNNQKPVAAGAIQIGAILPLTGDAAQYGNNDREGMLLAVSQANANGGISGRKIEVLFEDCQTEAKLALSGFNKLKAQGVNAIVDDAISTISLAMVPLLEPNKVVLLSTGASNPSLSGASPYFFRIWNSDAFEGVVTANYIKATFPSGKIALLHVNNDYGKGLHDVLRKELAGSAVEIVADDSFDVAARDFRPQIAKINESAPAAIYLVGYAAQTGVAARQLREAGVSAAIIGTVAMEDPEFVKLAGGGAEGVVYPFPVAPTGDAVKEFKEAFRKMYGKDPGLLHDCGFDAANLLIKAMREKGTSGEDIRAYLSSLRSYQGASGEISFDANGDVNKPMHMKVIRNGEFIPKS